MLLGESTNIISHTAGLAIEVPGPSAKPGKSEITIELLDPPLVADCFANLEGKVIDTRFVTKYCLFVLEVLQAWIDPAQKNPKTIHHRGYGTFVVDGETIKLKSPMR